jgi:hypothetical protein
MVMSRLIDADKLLNKIDAYMCGSQDVMFVKELIKEQPTAFDVEKVVEQLECEEGTVCGHKFINKNCFGCEGCNDCKMEDAYRYAIDIVKAGGIDEETS